MNHLFRELAPITSSTWEMLDDEARTRLLPALNGRKLVDFTGPNGWGHSSTSVGRVTQVIDAPTSGVTARARVVLPLAEVRVQFTLARSELDAADRGAVDVDLSALDKAAADLATTENSAIFNGWDAAGFTGIIPAIPTPTVRDSAEPADLARAVAAAVAQLKRSGIDGPYGLALDTDSWVDVEGGSDEGGSPLAHHLHRILGGPALWVPNTPGPVVVSLRGGDFAFESGQDIALGYSSHTSDEVTLYLEESFSFRVATPEAAVALF
ncbi:family 1 encapsulin nanocompartment shell protein [Leifsonia sp. 22587]|uniref:family 1 encapsulin nanocompartment shell protein n=1 Tax=Leifsonia sp. 22587 TaxID=3453946 RepID=UPI003F85DC79